MNDETHAAHRPAGEDLPFVLRDLAWADVVIDATQAAASPTAPVPAALPAPYRPWENGNDDEDPTYTTRVSAPGSPVEVVATHSMRFRGRDDWYILDGYALVRRGTKGAVAVLITYPDGYRIGVVTGYYGDYDNPAHVVWRKYLDQSPDAFGRMLSFTPTWHTHTGPTVLARHADAFRGATQASWAWFRTPPPADWAHDQARSALFVEGASHGFTSPAAYLKAQADVPSVGSVLDAQEAGWNLADPDARSWMRMAGRSGWLYRGADYRLLTSDLTGRPDGPDARPVANFGVKTLKAIFERRRFSDLKAVRDAGWAADAVEVLISQGAEGAEEPETASPEALMARWTGLGLTPAQASVYVLAGLRPGEVATMVANGTVPDPDVLRALTALRAGGSL